MNSFVSSFTGASNARFDDIDQITMTFSTCLVYNIWCLETFNFFGIQGYSPVSVCDSCSVWIRLNFFVSSFTGASNARSDGMCVITVINSTCLVFKIMIIRRLDFSDTKAIVHVRSANIHQFLNVLGFFFIHRSIQWKE